MYSYRWKVYCSSTGALVSESELTSMNTFSVKSTPLICLHKIECVIEDGESQSVSSASFKISSVVGMFKFCLTTDCAISS